MIMLINVASDLINIFLKEIPKLHWAYMSKTVFDKS